MLSIVSNDDYYLIVIELFERLLRWQNTRLLTLKHSFHGFSREWAILYPSRSDLVSVLAGLVGALLWRCWRAELASPRQDRMNSLSYDALVTHCLSFSSIKYLTLHVIDFWLIFFSFAFKFIIEGEIISHIPSSTISLSFSLHYPRHSPLAINFMLFTKIHNAFPLYMYPCPFSLSAFILFFSL